MKRYEAHDNVVLRTWIAAILGVAVLFGVPYNAFANDASINASVLCADAVSKDSSEEEIKQALKACVGKTAKEGLAVAEAADYPATFRDSAKVNVTSAVKDGSNTSEVGNAKITEVDVSGGFLFFGPDVTFTLDYTDPEAKAERDAKEAHDAELKAATDRLRSCEGCTADEALALAKEAEHSYTFEDSAGEDVTKAVEDASSGAEVHGAKVKKVSVSGGFLFMGPSVTFTLDYTDPAAKAERDAEEAERRSKLPKVAFKGVKNDYSVKRAGKGCKKFALVGKMQGKLVNKSDESVREDKLPVLMVDNQKYELTLFDADGDTIYSIPANSSCRFSYTFKEIYNDNLPEHEFSVGQCEEVNSIGLKKAITSFGNEFESQMDDMPEKIEEFKAEEQRREEEKQRQEEERRRQEEEARAQAEAEREQRRIEAEQARLQETCWITQTGECYHRTTGCRTLSRSKYLESLTVEEARSRGYRPCGVCH